MIDSPTSLAVLTIHQSIYKVLNVPASLPHTWMSNNIALDSQNVVIELNHRPPPVAADIIAQFNAEWPEVIDA
jgi:hypothetical protein